ncbi:MAG: DUF2344 domain-containing protein [Cyanobacteria bacterium SIG29]|nr:DUF2344 domain-containing protein [Cyanobacteria bacterium SIG29]
MNIKNLYNVKKPYQYIGGEYLSYNKDFNTAKVKIALAFPDKYEIAISNLGQKILYDIINSDERFMADRIYAPDFDYKETLDSLYGLESKKNAKDFDIIGFSLQYELAYPTLLEMLKMSNIEVLRKDRDENSPIIMAGGPGAFNPKPLENFIDLFMVGDGEELIIDVLEKYSELKEKSLKRNEIILELAKIEGIYSSELKNKTKKRVYDISKNNKAPLAPVPYSSSVHDRTIIEIRRGCGRMCRFCQAGHVNLPIRERKAQDVISMVKDSICKTGYDEYSLLSLSSNDYTNIESVIEELSCEMNKKKVSVSLPSQRIDRYSQKLAQLVRGVRSTTVTLAPEAGSQRLRNVINKNLTEEQIIDTILNCYKNGTSNVKLYFMIGLPTEAYEDLDEMVELFSKIKYRSKLMRKELELRDALNLTCTVSIFVPKPFTPFQWCAQFSQEEIRERIKYLLDKVKPIKGIKINYHSSFTSKLECAMTRADERYNDFLYALHKKGVYLSTWDENIDKQLWEDTALECGIDINKEAQRKYDLNEDLPWDVIDIGLDKNWLIEQYNNAMAFKNITPCEFNCVQCGVCKNLKTHKVIDNKYISETKIEEETTTNQTRFYTYRIKITKKDEMKYISHLDWQNTIIKMLFRSGLKLYFSQGFNPTPRFSLGIALPLFVESECELIDIELIENISPLELIKRLNNVLPSNIKVLDAKQITRQDGAIDIIAQWASFTFEPLEQGILKFEDLLYIKDRISSSNEIFIEKINKKGIKKLVNIKSSIKAVDVTDNKITMILKVGQSEEIPSVKPDDVIKLYNNDVIFKIKRTAFYDKDMNEL